MRVIAGTLGGRSIPTPKGLPVRPTTDRMREALGNILGNYFDWEGLKTLELFSGTGCVSLELWSRGVRDLTSVDQHTKCVQAQKKLHKSWEIAEIQVFQSAALSFIKHTETQYDLIFMDPPYQMPHQAELVLKIFELARLTKRGFVILEHMKQASFEDLPYFSFMKTYGSSCFSFFEYEP